MRNVFYDSDSLGKSIYIADVQSLTRNDLNVLERELNLAISNMRVKMHEERDVAESDWLYGISLKIKICEQFLERIDELASLDSSKLNHYHLLYLRQEISNELGPLKAQQLFDKSRVGAVAQLRKESVS